MAITTQPHYFHNGFPALSSPPPRPPSSTPLSYHLLKCINSSEINSLLYDAVSAYVMIFVQKMGESESGFSFAFGSQPFGWMGWLDWIGYSSDHTTTRAPAVLTKASKIIVSL